MIDFHYSEFSKLTNCSYLLCQIHFVAIYDQEICFNPLCISPVGDCLLSYEVTWLIESINSLCPSDAIRRHRTTSTSAQVMACCLMAPSHYLNQCWLIIDKVQWHSGDGNFTKDTSITNLFKIEITDLKFPSNLPGANELTSYVHVFIFLQECW